MTQKELDVILDKHKKWLNDEDGGERAVLDYKNLDYLDLNRASLDGASLYGASLNRASLDGASLDGASLNGASLNGASLYRASLYGASLNRASLDGASLYGASLDGASLDRASLDRASLDEASLDGASLNGASLNGASLDGASLDRAKDIPFIPMSCPDHGGFTAFKKVRADRVFIIELYIPASAKRSSATGRKCRCEYAKVKNIEELNKSECVSTDVTEVVNLQHCRTVYKKGEMVYPNAFDENRFNECSTGIHFFINKQEAIDW